jgi:hypothetical protein
MTITLELLISSLFNPTKHENNIKIKDKDKIIYNTKPYCDTQHMSQLIQTHQKNFKYLRMIEKMKYRAPMNVERKG